MDAQEFAQAAIVFVATAAVCGVFINFFSLLSEELKKCSIMDGKKKHYAVLSPSRRAA